MTSASISHEPSTERRVDAPLPGLPVAVLGAGPVGLAAAAELIERGIPFFIVEAGATVGANLVDYGHVRLFTPWRYALSPATARLLATTDWVAPAPDELPRAIEVVQRVLEPFAHLSAVASVLNLGTEVVAVSREGFDKVKSVGRAGAPFVIRAVRNGALIEFKARAVIDATGTWTHPNPIGANGLPAIGESAAADRLFYGIPDVLGTYRSRYAGRRTLVVGAGHSAANALLALGELAAQVPDTRLVWALRSPGLGQVFGGGDADALPARGELGTALRALHDSGGMQVRTGLRITRIERIGQQLGVVGIDPAGREQRIEGIDEIVCATGQRPDLTLTSELRVKLDPWLECNEALGPLIDPNLHSCGTVRPHGHRELAHPEPDFYTVGVKSYGRAPTFLMATGFEQVRSVIAAVAGDLHAADRVELDLPETGVCSVSTGVANLVASASCCGGPPKADPSACCVIDEQKKAQGTPGCGSRTVDRTDPVTSTPRSTCC